MSDITYTRITPAGEEKCSLLDGDGMTREEKIEAIIRFCEEDNRDCGDCIISEPCAKCLGAFDRQPDRCNEAYNILVNAGLIKPPVNFVKVEQNDEIKLIDGWEIHEENSKDIGRTVYAKPIFKFVKANPDDEVESESDAVDSDAVNHPNHYTQNGIECIAAIRASMTADGFMDYCKGNVLKYIWRWRDKGGAEDLRKARVYLEWLIEEAEK